MRMLSRRNHSEFSSLSSGIAGGEGWGEEGHFRNPSLRLSPHSCLAGREGTGVTVSLLGLREGARRNAGFSLLEVMCAILILGIALTGMTMGLTTALTSSKESEIQTAAAMIAAGQIEILRASGAIIDGEEQGELTGGLSAYKWKQTVKGTDVRGLHDVTVEVENSKTSAPIYELKTMLFSTPSESTDEGPGKQKDKKRKGRRG